MGKDNKEDFLVGAVLVVEMLKPCFSADFLSIKTHYSFVYYVGSGKENGTMQTAAFVSSTMGFFLFLKKICTNMPFHPT